MRRRMSLACIVKSIVGVEWSSFFLHKRWITKQLIPPSSLIMRLLHSGNYNYLHNYPPLIVVMSSIFHFISVLGASSSLHLITIVLKEPSSAVPIPLLTNVTKESIACISPLALRCCFNRCCIGQEKGSRAEVHGRLLPSQQHGGW